MFYPSETADRQLSDATPHPIHMAVRNVCDDADFSPYMNPGVSMYSAGVMVGTSGIQSNKHEAAFEISLQDTLRFPQK
jgi:hypothetical protein